MRTREEIDAEREQKVLKEATTSNYYTIHQLANQRAMLEVLFDVRDLLKEICTRTPEGRRD
jgi:hypothetical protein